MLNIYFLSGKITSLEKKFIDYEKLKKIVESKTFEEFVNLLEGSFFKLSSNISNPEDIIKFFENERMKMIEEIEKTFDIEIKKFFLLKYDYFNLANLIKGKEIFSPYGTINFYNLKEAFEKNDFSKIPEFLNDTFKIIKTKNSVEEKLLFIKNDYYEKIYKIAEIISKFIKNYVRIEIDFANLRTYLNKKMAGKKIEISDLIKNGKIKREIFLDEGKLWEKLKLEYKKVQTPLNEENIEVERYGTVIDYIKKGRVKPDTVDKLISFYIAKEIEIENLQRISLSKFYKQEEDFLKKIFIPPYQYRE